MGDSENLSVFLLWILRKPNCTVTVIPGYLGPNLKEPVSKGNKEESEGKNLT